MLISWLAIVSLLSKGSLNSTRMILPMVILLIVFSHGTTADEEPEGNNDHTPELKSYHEPNSEEDEVPVGARIVAGMVTSPREASHAEGERRLDGGVQEGGLEGEEKEDLPTQPPPVEERPKEGKEP